MKNKKFNLSEKIWKVDEKIQFIQIKDIKEFIKLLKVKFREQEGYDLPLIDNFAGDKLK